MTVSIPAVGTVLVVDLEPKSLKAIRTYLVAHHYRVHAAQGSEQAVTLVRELAPDVVVLGIEQPGQNDGTAICRRIKTDTLSGFIPVILILDANQDRYRACTEAGADDFVVMPIRSADLLVRVATLLRLKRRYDTVWEQNQSLAADLDKSKAEREQAVRAAQEASVLKDSIVYNVSHELRTPMLQIKSAVAMLAEDARAASPNGSSTLADHATAATARMETLVANITQLAASLNVKSEPFRLVDAVNVALRQLGRQWASSAAVERVKTLVHEHIVVSGDRGGVSQVLQQLIDNAIKFSPQGGPVEIATEQHENMIRIMVRDQGIGISTDQFERIFQAFYQVDSGPTRSFGGAGVGLSIAKLILDKMGTSIQVESKPGTGSTFSFALPVAHLDEVAVSQTQTAY